MSQMLRVRVRVEAELDGQGFAIEDRGEIFLFEPDWLGPGEARRAVLAATRKLVTFGVKEEVKDIMRG